MSNQDVKMFEFLLTIDNNIIVQRIFSVKGYNKKVKNSLDLYDTVTSISKRIEEDMKMKNLIYMSENEEYISSDENQENTYQIKKDNFLLEIKSDDEVFIQRSFPAYVYHPKVRVDIRHMLRAFLSELTDTLSSLDLEENYLDKKLEVDYLGKNE